ncbi:MAG: hypothetical protein ACP5XB_14635, partial [Isosphaeraceae bacterium]
SLSAMLLLVALAFVFSSISVSSPGAERAKAPNESARIGKLQLRVAEFVAASEIVSRTGRGTPYVLPLTLPERWELNVEIQASLPALRRIRIAGLVLDAGAESGPASDQPPSIASSSVAWHQIQIRHTPVRTRLEIDGNSALLKPDHEPLSRWLTIEPAPDETAVLRNLIVTW